VDLASIIGVVMGIGAILLGQHLEGGHIGSITQPTAALIVVGGTLGATLLATPIPDALRAMKLLKSAFLPGPSRAPDTVKRLVEMASVARKEGIIALESLYKDHPDPFFRLAIQHVVDGTNAQLLREILDTDLHVRVEERNAAAKLFETAGGFAPTVGILGAVLGLIHVMENLDDPSKLGSGIAVAFVATIYGVGLANLLFIPIGNKLKRLTAMDRTLQEMVIEGALAIQAGQSPRAVEDRLHAFLADHKPAAQDAKA
jgi:chemotaxis protein MotA